MDYVIGKFTKSKYIHTAMVVKNPSWNENLRGVYIIESNWENVPDAEDNEIKCGVELIPIQTALTDETEHIYWRRLRCTRNKEFYQKMNDTQSIVHNRPYDFIITDWLKAAFNIDIGNTHRKRTFWCSALVSFVMCKLGFLNNAIAAGRDKDKLTSSELLGLFNSSDLPNQIAANFSLSLKTTQQIKENIWTKNMASP